MVTSPSEKRYIGITQYDLETRKKQHIQDSKNPKYKFQRAIKKYGPENFIWEVVDTGETYEELLFKEVEYIRFYDSKKKGYNCTDRGQGVVGRKATKKQRDRTSQIVKDHWKTKTPEQVKSLTKHLLKGGEVNKITVIDGNGNVFESMTIAANFHNISSGLVTILINEKRPSTEGICFKHYEGKIETFSFPKKIKKTRRKYTAEEKARLTCDHFKVKVMDSDGIVHNSIQEAAKATNMNRRTVGSLLKSGKGHRFTNMRFFYVR